MERVSGVPGGRLPPRTGKCSSQRSQRSRSSSLAASVPRSQVMLSTREESHGYPAGYPAGFSRQKPMANPGFPGEPGWLFQAEGGSQRASIHAFDPAVDPGWHSSYISGIIPSYSIHTSWYIHTIFIWLWYTVWISSRISGGSTPLRRTDFLARKFFDFYERLLLSTPSFSTEQLLETSESGDPDFLGSLSAQNPGA